MAMLGFVILGLVLVVVVLLGQVEASLNVITTTSSSSTFVIPKFLKDRFGGCKVLPLPSVHLVYTIVSNYT